MRWIALVGCLVWGCGGSGTPDAGPEDAGAMPDAGMEDAGIGDAGRPDAGPDTVAPTLAIDFPVSRAFVETDTVVLAGRADDAEGIASVRVAGVDATSDDGFANWRATVSLTRGWNTLAVEATDAHGNVTTSERRVLSRTPIGRVVNLAHDPAANALYAMVEPGREHWLQRIDLATGLAENVADLGPLFSTAGNGPRGLALDLATQRAFVCVYQPGPTSEVGVWEIDLATGALRAFSTPTEPDPSGPQFRFPISVVTDVAGGRLLVADNGLEAIVAVDLTTGARSVLSDATDLGPDMLDYNMSLALDPAGGRLLIAAHRIRGTNGVYGVDLATGDRSALAVSQMGVSPNFQSPNGVVRLTASGPAYVLDRFQGLIEANLDTGARSMLTPRSGTFRPNGFDVVGVDGAVVFGNASTARIIGIDPSTGTPSTLTQNAFPQTWEAPPFRFARAIDDTFVMMGSETFLRLRDGVLETLREPSDFDPSAFVQAFAVHAPSAQAYVSLELPGAQLGLERIDVETGAVTVIRDGATSGPAVLDAEGLVIDADGTRAFVLDATSRPFSVSLTDGTATDLGAPAFPDHGAIGWHDGRLLIAEYGDDGPGRLVSVDPSDGSVIVVSDASHAGPPITDPSGIGATSDGTIWLSDDDRVLAIASDGTRRLVQEKLSFTAIALYDGLRRLSVDGDRVYVQDGNARLLQLDPASGALVGLAEQQGGNE